MQDDRLKLAAYCPLCGPKMVQVEARVLGGEGDAQLLHVTCRRCAAQMLTLTLVTEGSSGSVGLVTDLSADDVVHFAHAAAISSDDVLAIHQWLTSPSFSWVKTDADLATSAPKKRRLVHRAPKRSRTAKSGHSRRSL